MRILEIQNGLVQYSITKKKGLKDSGQLLLIPAGKTGLDATKELQCSMDLNNGLKRVNRRD